MTKLWTKRTIQICCGLLLCSLFVWAQKDDEPAKEGITLTDLGVTTEQKNQIDAMWKLKRQKHLQAVKDLKTLNRLVKDTLMSDEHIRETLKTIRTKRIELQKKIDKAEAELIKVIPPRAQLHLTVLGVLDNGLPRRTTKTQADKEGKEKGEDALTVPEQSVQ